MEKPNRHCAHGKNGKDYLNVASGYFQSVQKRIGPLHF